MRRKPPHRRCVDCGRPVGRRWREHVRCNECTRKLHDDFADADRRFRRQ